MSFCRHSPKCVKGWGSCGLGRQFLSFSTWLPTCLLGVLYKNIFLYSQNCAASNWCGWRCELVTLWKAELGDRESKILYPFFFCDGKTAASVVVVLLICLLWVSDSRLTNSNAQNEFEVHNSVFYLYAATGMPCCLNEVVQMHVSWLRNEKSGTCVNFLGMCKANADLQSVASLTL